MEQPPFDNENEKSICKTDSGSISYCGGLSAIRAA